MQTTTQSNTFVGLKPYAPYRVLNPNNRNAELQTFLTLWHRERFMALVGQVGAGKTTFLHTQVWPTFRKEDSQTALFSIQPQQGLFRSFAMQLADKHPEQTVLALQRQLEEGELFSVQQILSSQSTSYCCICIDQLEYTWQTNQDEELMRFFAILSVLCAKNLKLKLLVTVSDSYWARCQELPYFGVQFKLHHIWLNALSPKSFYQFVQATWSAQNIKVNNQVSQSLEQQLQETQWPWSTWQYGLSLLAQKLQDEKSNTLSEHAWRAFSCEGQLNAKLEHQWNSATEIQQIQYKRLFQILLTQERKVWSQNELAHCLACTTSELRELLQTCLGSTKALAFFHYDKFQDAIELENWIFSIPYTRWKRWKEEAEQLKLQYLRYVHKANMYTQGKGALLQKAEISLAQTWQNTPLVCRAWSELYDEHWEACTHFIAKSESQNLADEAERQAQQERNQKRRKKQFRILLIGAIGASILGLFSWLQYSQASKAERKAFQEKTRAEYQAQRALAAQYEAEQHAMYAANQKQRAEHEQQEAQTHATHAKEEAKKAQKAGWVAQEALFYAEKERQRATYEAEQAQQATEEAIQAQQEAEHQEQIASQEKQKVKQWQGQRTAQAVAIKSQQIKSKQLQSQLAIQSYYLWKHFAPTYRENDIYQALYQALKRWKGHRVNELVLLTSSVRKMANWNDQLLLASGNGELWQWDPQTSKSSLHLQTEGAHYGICTTENELYTWGDYKGIYQWSKHTKEWKIFQSSHPNPIKAVAANPKEQLLYFIDDTGTVYKYNPHTQQANLLSKLPEICMTLVFDTRSHTLIAGSMQGALWQIDFEGSHQKLASWDAAIRTMKISPKGKTLLIGLENGVLVHAKQQANYWSFDEPIEVHEAAIEDVAFHPSGKYWATASRDGSATYWDQKQWLNQGMTYHPIRVQTSKGWALSVVFDKNTERWFTGSVYGATQEWPLDAKAYAEELCPYITVPLSVLEWEIYIGNAIKRIETCTQKP